MRRARFIPVTLLVCGCGPDPDFVTDHGIRVFDETGLADRAKIELATEAAIRSRGRGRASMDGLKVQFQSDAVVLNGGAKRRCADYTEYLGGGCSIEVGGTYLRHLGLIKVMLGDDCLKRSAFVHELGHRFQDKIEHVTDAAHDPSGPYWSPGGYVDSAIKAARAAEECEDDER